MTAEADERDALRRDLDRVRAAIFAAYAQSGAGGQTILAALGQELLCVAGRGRQKLPDDQKLRQVIEAFGQALLVVAHEPVAEIDALVQQVFIRLHDTLRGMDDAAAKRVVRRKARRSHEVARH